jgi:transposase
MQVSKLGFLGGDVSKGMCNFVLENSTGIELEPNFQLDDNQSGHKSLYKLIGSWKKVHGLEKIVVGLESTGGYENNWYKGLRSSSKELSLEVFRINPKRIYHAAKTEGRRTITDGVSAGIIASYLRKNYGTGVLTKKRLRNTNDDNAPIRTLHKYIKSLLKQNTRSKNRLEKILYRTMPELLSLKSEKYSNWFLELLIKYPSKKAVLRAGLKGLRAIKGLRSSKASTILEELKVSVGGDSNTLLSMTLKEEATDILERTKKIDRLKKSLREELEKDENTKEQIEIITSIKGVAEDSAVGFLLEFGQVENYEKGRNLVAYFGINPTLKQSGDKTYKTRMCKDGSSNARAVIYMMAENVVLYEPYFQNVYRKHRLNGKTHRSAIGVVMSKLTRVLYGMLKNKSRFDSNIDLINQLKKEKETTVKQAKQTQEKSKTERRHQRIENEANAPISQRQRKKRKQEQNVSN